MSRSEILMIAGMAVVTFAVRYPVLWLVGRYQLPQAWLRALRYVPVAVLSALIVPAILFPTGGPLPNPITNPYLVAGIAAALVAWTRGNLLLTLAVGLIVFWAWRWVLMAFF
jgi:branched-subunit amino acid transport protein